MSWLLKTQFDLKESNDYRNRMVSTFLLDAEYLWHLIYYYSKD